MQVVAVTACIVAWAAPAGADRQYHSGFGKTLGKHGCSHARAMVAAFYQAAENMRRLQGATGGKAGDNEIRDYLLGNLELDKLPKSSAEYKVFSRLAELILKGEDRETVQSETLEVCRRELGPK